MISVLGQQLWKNKLVSGVLTIVLGAMVLAWPGPINPCRLNHLRCRLSR
jgi:uncharacterized membrane protein HdeD (DUF308 family)